MELTIILKMIERIIKELLHNHQKVMILIGMILLMMTLLKRNQYLKLDLIL